MTIAAFSSDLGKPLFEMCCFHMGIAQIALDPPTHCQTGTWKKNAPKQSSQAFTAPPPTFGQCPYGNNTFQKGASLSQSSLTRMVFVARVRDEHLMS